MGGCLLPLRPRARHQGWQKVLRVGERKGPKEVRTHELGAGRCRAQEQQLPDQVGGLIDRSCSSSRRSSDFRFPACNAHYQVLISSMHPNRCSIVGLDDLLQTGLSHSGLAAPVPDPFALLFTCRGRVREDGRVLLALPHNESHFVQSRYAENATSSCASKENRNSKK